MVWSSQFCFGMLIWGKAQFTMVACAFRHCLIATFYIVPTLWLPAFWATAHIVWTTQPRIWNRQDRSWWPLFRLAWGHHCDMVALFRSVWWQGGPYWDWHCRTFRPFCLCPIYQLVWHLPTSLKIKWYTKLIYHRTANLNITKSNTLLLEKYMFWTNVNPVWR